MAGITIDQFPLLPGSGLILTSDWAPVGRNDITYHTPFPEVPRAIQKNLESIPNSPLSLQAQIVNGGFAVSIATGAMTVNLVTASGDTPSAADPVYIVFRHGTTTNGTYTVRKVVAVLSFTVASGATLGIATSIVNTEVFILGVNDTAGIQLGLINPKLSGGSYYVPDEWALKSTTGGTGGNNSGIIYTPTSAVTKPIAVLGVIRWDSGISSPGTWTTPTSVQTISNGALLARLNENANDTLTRMALFAPLSSPNLTGIPLAPTAGVNTNTTQIATTAFVLGQGATSTPSMDGVAAIGIATRYAREDHVHPTDTSRSPVVSPTFTGTPVAPTAAQDTNTTQISTTAFVLAQAAGTNPLMDGTAAPGTAVRFSRADHVHPTDTSRAPLASPGLTGTPTSTTAAVDTNTTQIATTAFVLAQAAGVGNTPVMDGTAAVGTSARYARSDHVHPTDTSRAPLASPGLTGTPTAPTAAVDTNTTQVATTAFVIGQAYAKLASPTLTGVPLAPTAANGTNTTQIATTAFVNNAVSAAGNYNPAAVVITGGTINNTTIGATTATTGSFTSLTCSAPLADDNSTRAITSGWFVGQKGTAAPLMDGTATAGTSAKWSPIDHVHSTDTSRAPLASPALTGTPTSTTAAVDTNTTQIATTAFVIGQAYAKLASPTLTGTPASPTAAADTNTTQIATTAFVIGQLASAAQLPVMDGTQAQGISLKTARADHVHPTDTSRSPVASPTFTGTPAAPTAAVDTNTTQIATTAFVIGQGYLKSGTATSTYAPLASPALTGTPTAPTAGVGTNTTQIATTAYVAANFSRYYTGSVIQSVANNLATQGNTTTTILTRTNGTNPASTEGVQLLSASITPKFSTSTLRIRVSGTVAINYAGGGYSGSNIVVFRDGTPILATEKNATPNLAYEIQDVNMGKDVAATAASATTFTVRIGASFASTTVYWNQGAEAGYFNNALMNWSLVVEEIGA